MPGSIAFMSTMCLLDDSSGAAISVRSALEALARSGFRCKSFTMSLFDSRESVPVATVLGSAATKEENNGKILVLERGGVEHRILLSKSTRGRNLLAQEGIKFRNSLCRWLKQTKPDLVVTYGGSNLMRSGQSFARSLGIPLVFYLGNAEYDDPTVFHADDVVVSPSQFLSTYYADTLGLDVQVLRPILNPERLIAAGEPSVASMPEHRRLGFVTFFNPLPHKGLTLFARLAQLASRERPDIRFLVTEGRMARHILRKWKLDLGAYHNTWLIPNQAHVKAVYARTAVLLTPSFWREGFARSVAEAQLCGIPVISSGRGGLMEALNGGGFVKAVPEECTQRHRAFPDDETVREWFETLTTLWDDDDAYRAATERARRAAAPYHPERTAAAAVGLFERLLASRA